MQKKWGKSITLLLITALLLMLAAGCGTKKEETKTEPTTSTETKTETKTEPTTTTTTEPTTTEAAGPELEGDFELQYFVGGYGDGFWKEAIAEFAKKYPKLKIKESAGPKINDQMKPRWIQGNPPDFVYIDGAGSNATQMVKDDQLLDMTDWLETAKNEDGKLIKDLLIMQPVKYDGKVAPIPFVFGTWGIFYDKAEFKKNGWNEPKNWEEFLAVSKQIQDSKKMYPFIHTGKYPYYINGGLVDTAILVNNNYDTSIFDKIQALEPGVFKSDAVKKALDQVKQLVDAKYIDPASAAINHTDSQSLFLQHKDAFIPNGLWVENEMKKDVPAGFEFGFVPSVTQAAGGKFVAIPYTSTIGVAKKAKNPEAAKAFMQFILTEKWAVRWAELTGALDNIKADLSQSAAVSSLSKQASGYYNSPDTIVAPYVELNADVDKVKQDSTQALANGKITPEEWMDRMEAAAEKARGKK
ncbi:ABC transporter substrate-binding protein [Paenibacillus guangzhouensis]|uniref:ABC transporter substrate-binding protein n=1 Tax=Paenibacillus guangzhouensis TaxID=1473112 RepID=UPI001266CD77|nr:extracellular solute-binding protein [Paenibacillus guangzhouensis]